MPSLKPNPAGKLTKLLQSHYQIKESLLFDHMFYFVDGATQFRIGVSNRAVNLDTGEYLVLTRVDKLDAKRNPCFAFTFETKGHLGQEEIDFANYLTVFNNLLLSY